MPFEQHSQPTAGDDGWVLSRLQILLLLALSADSFGRIGVFLPFGVLFFTVRVLGRFGFLGRLGALRLLAFLSIALGILLLPFIFSPRRSGRFFRRSLTGASRSASDAGLRLGRWPRKGIGRSGFVTHRRIVGHVQRALSAEVDSYPP